MSYCHEDSRIVFPEMKRLHEAGYRIWYDEGIAPSKEWSEEIASALLNSALFLFFVSPRAIKSKGCRDEADFALDIEKTFLGIYLEDTKLPDGLKLRINRIQPIFKHKLAPEAYERKVGKFLSSLELGTLERDQPAALEKSAKKSALPSIRPSKSAFIPLVLLAILVVTTVIMALIWSRNQRAVVLSDNSNLAPVTITTPNANSSPSPTPSPVVEIQPKGSRNSSENLDSPLGEPDQPNRNGTTAKEKVASLTHIIEWLDVQHSERYQRQGDRIASDVYAYDYCDLAGVSLPRAWRLSDAISVCSWLDQNGSTLGWKRTQDMDTLQTRANEGKVALICGYALAGGRFVALVVPETTKERALRNNGTVICPLQSRAGRRNYKYKSLRWWDESKFDLKFWFHD